MAPDDQAAVIEFLASPTTHDGARVERIDTHAAIVFLAGARAYKLKRAVRFDYLDFSTVERRRVSCEAEVRLNRRTAPDMYLGVLAVTRESDGTLALGGTGMPVDWVVEMVRFDQSALFDRLAEAGRLDVALMVPLADAIAAFHAAAAPRPDHGGKAGMAWVIEGNASGVDEYGAEFVDHRLSRAVADLARTELERHGTLLDRRRDTGYVRQCHGDLHLRNIALIDGRPTLFDGIEFNDEIACTDVLYDLAFLLMDLWRRRLPGHANAVWNRYLAETKHVDGLRLLPLFLSCRAAVRAKTSLTAAHFQADDRQRRSLQALAQRYLSMADAFLRPPGPALVAIGGLSGTGKSTIARQLAPLFGAAPGAVVFRSDEIRKRLCGVPLLERLGPDGYTSEVTERVYSTLAGSAGATIAEGCSVVADAVYAKPEDRQAIERVAVDASIPFVGVWLEAPEAQLVDRTMQRRNDASDADADVVHRQHQQHTGPITWHRIDASAPAERVLQAVTDVVRKLVPMSSPPP